MDRSGYVEAVRQEADRLLEVAGGTGGGDIGRGAVLGPAVPACPGWSVERLVGHVGRVYRSTAGWVRDGEGPPRESIGRPPAGEAVLAWTASGRDELLAALEGLPDGGQEVPTWLGEQPAGFWPRRMAVESAIHRWDAESAVATRTPGPVDPELAVDGIDELFTVLVPLRHPDVLPGDGETIHVHATDTEGEWLLTLGPGAPGVERAHAKGDVAARGPASDLLLFLHNRVPVERLATFGDTALLDRWTASVRL